ncbi:aldehyde dehydrogenase (NADP(+)) [Intrasporangium calvum]|uniref:Aldehyde Dehydrogenase n=1 Tax=Intrasporangium calvum (strain ATCC 23552 / DSM 43043 / JCM 3097 / NBRC 12989 / NCIMB 10167 / NRRL B-3866 / 7 KIP) TaxID=710696 RepID=E6SD51_INTC7|nr:aldehyde dehydrogenase (NADP(+)) [Intrasporangium calvum]ADU49669.1 Aldehyde Dehydrogenase [Intrasporangium calvum DSM 43043]
MLLTGQSIIAGTPTAGSGGTFTAVDPSTGAALGPEVSCLTPDEVALATRAAAESCTAYRSTTPTERAAFLEAIAEEIEALGDELLERAHAETALPLARLQGERARTCGQLRMFAGVVRQGDHLGVRIDSALPDRAPLPRPDLRLRQIALGPVAVFGASNFPLAFSTAGGDTASALAAGCPVVVKAHNAHPGTSELVGQAVARAAGRTQMPAGVFSLVFGLGNEVGMALVTDPRIHAVGFTGSRAGGLALVAAAAGRAQPIPVYAEMSSTNPVILLEGALTGDPTRLATAYLTSLTSGSGQFCTNPGLLFLPDGEAGDAFLAAVAEQAAQAAGQTMLTPQIRTAFGAGIERLGAHPSVRTIAQGVAGAGDNAPAPMVFATELTALAEDHGLTEEVFGAAGLVVRFGDVTRLAEHLADLAGQLTATIHATDADHEAAAVLVPVLETRVGRILFNGWPTGVEVTHAMVHGGPFPATSDARSTSVGSLAIERFQRPVCYQDVPASLLPQPVRDDNPWQLSRRIDGTVEPPQ